MRVSTEKMMIGIIPGSISIWDDNVINRIYTKDKVFFDSYEKINVYYLLLLIIAPFEHK